MIIYQIDIKNEFDIYWTMLQGGFVDYEKTYDAAKLLTQKHPRSKIRILKTETVLIMEGKY